MKPIFKKEQDFLEKKLNVTILKDSWRNGSKIYANHFDKKAYLIFKVDLLNNRLICTKNISDEYKDTSLTFEQELDMVRDELQFKETESINATKEIIKDYTDNVGGKKFVSISGGKDSDVMKWVVDKSINGLKKEGYEGDLNYDLIAFNTSNESAETYLHLKKVHAMTKDNIISPEVGWHKWIETKKNYFVPSVFVRNCCSTYKEGQLTKVMDKKEDTITFLGMRRLESNKRSFYDFDLNKAYDEHPTKKINGSESWKKILPIVHWSDAEVYLYAMREGIKFNPMYEMGFNRVGCLICPFQTDYIDMLIKHYYPNQWLRWKAILLKNYEIYGVESRLKWSTDEWTEGGSWKAGMSKDGLIASKKATDERISELAKIKGIDEETAKKFFNKVCNCGKKMNVTEISMNMKFFGVNLNEESFSCKKCFCDKLDISKDEYAEKVIEFTGSCDLF